MDVVILFSKEYLRLILNSNLQCLFSNIYIRRILGEIIVRTNLTRIENYKYVILIFNFRVT